ncbi:lactate/malate family dehydrogenase, partial [Staphylococcus epidermidis]
PIPHQFVIIHIPKHKLQPHLKDLNHAALYTSSPLTLKPPQYQHSKHPDLLLITPPPPQKPPQTPLQLLHKNTKIIKTILTTLIHTHFHPFFLIPPNPLHILTRYLKEVTRLPAEPLIASR